MIGVLYGTGPAALAETLGVTPIEANELLRLHRAAFPRFWQWREDYLAQAMLTNEVASVFGWRHRIGADTRPNSTANFPMQSNGAEMLRIGAIAATETGIRVCAPIHDAFMIAAPADRIDDDVEHMREIMTRAGRVVTGGIEVRTSATVVRWPDRYLPPGSQVMWDRVMGLLQEVEALA